MLSTQMQMSTLNANMEMIKALQSIQTAFNQSSLSTATVIGKMLKMVQPYKERWFIENFTIESIENIDGQIMASCR